jgi:hypothetical protein
MLRFSCDGGAGHMIIDMHVNLLAIAERHRMTGAAGAAFVAHL